MSDYNTLKTTINANIKTNSNQEITGSVLNSVLNAMVNSLGAGYQFMGVATASTNPGAPDENVFYLAGAGTYPNFQNAVVADGNIGVFAYSGSWNISVIPVIDLVDNLTDGGVNKALSAEQGKVLNAKISESAALGDADADLDIADEDGNVLARFENGNFRVKYFDSAKNNANLGIDSIEVFSITEDYPVDTIVKYEGLLYRFIVAHEAGLWDSTQVEQTNVMQAATLPVSVEDSGNSADLDIADEDGNVLARFENGNFRTKNFDSLNIPNLSDVVNRYKGKRFSLLGDSISTFGTPSATNEDGTYCYSYYPSASCRYSEDGVDSIPFNVKNTYWMKLIEKTGMVLGINDSYRGTMVSGTTNAFNLQSRIDHLGENGTPNVILVYGGTNDAGLGVTIGTFNTENPANYTDAQIASLPVTTFADAYRTMLIRLMKKYPLAEIVVILPTFTQSYYTITDLDLYVEIIKEACDFFGIKYIDARCTGINVYNRATYLIDGIHPNVAGMDLLFKKIYKQLIFN